MNLSMICAEREPTRDRHVILGDLTKMIHPDFHPRIWALINELENAAWESGASEGYDHGLQDAGSGCDRPGGCVCGGDVPAVRRGCGWYVHD